jgi:hypothetical protein
MGDITFLRDFESQMQNAVSQGLLFPGDPLLDQPRQDRLQRVSENWMNSIQFTEPNFSLKSVDKLLEDSIKKYLIEPLPSESLDKLPGSLKLPKFKVPRSERTREMLKQWLGKLSGSPPLPKPNIRSSVTVYNSEGMLSVIGTDAEDAPLMEALEKVDSFKHNS